MLVKGLDKMGIELNIIFLIYNMLFIRDFKLFVFVYCLEVFFYMYVYR